MMTEDELYTDLGALVVSMGMTLVDCRLQQTRFGYVVQLIVQKKGGIGTNDCAQVHRLVFPRLELLAESRDIHLEVSSPGLDRKIRLPREYPMFLGRGIRIVLKTGHEKSGILLAADDHSCTLDVQGTPLVVDFESIGKAKLDYTQEG